MRQPINHKYLTGRRLMLAGAILLALTHMLGFLPTEEPRNLPLNWTRITTFIPVWAWAIGWGSVVVMSVIELFRGRGRWGISLAMLMTGATAAAYAASYLLTVVVVSFGSREWFYVGLYTSTALMVIGLLTKVGALKHEEASPHD